MRGKVAVFKDLMESTCLQEFKDYVDGLSITKPSPVFHILSGKDVVDKEVRHE